jgi:hypothetical protein
MGSASAIQRLIAIDVGHRDLGGGNQPEIVLFDLEQVVGEFGQLAGAEQAPASSP